MAVHSREYQEQLKQVHRDADWGTTGARNFGDYVVSFLKKRRYESVLDYGAGQGSLGKYVRDHLDVDWTDYDPGVDGIDRLEPGREYDLVVSSDVLEHVEPECLEGTLEELRNLASKAQFHHIACCLSGSTLPDGRDAHLIVEDLDWWLPQFEVPGWVAMYAADVWVKKRGHVRRHCHIQVDKL